MAKSEILAAIKAFEASISTYHHDFCQGLRDIDSRIATLTNTTHLPPLSLPPTPTTPTYEELLWKFEIAMSNSADSSLPNFLPSQPPCSVTVTPSTPPLAPNHHHLPSATAAVVPLPLHNSDSPSILQAQTPPPPLSNNSQTQEVIPRLDSLGVDSFYCLYSHPPSIPIPVSQLKSNVDRPETEPSTEPSHGIDSLLVGDELDNAVSSSIFPTTHPPPLLLRKDIHRRLWVSESECLFPTSLHIAASRDKWEEIAYTSLSSSPVFSPSKCLTIIFKEPIFMIVFGSAVTSGKEEPPGSLFIEHITSRESLLVSLGKSDIHSISWIEEPPGNFLDLNFTSLYAANRGFIGDSFALYVLSSYCGDKHLHLVDPCVKFPDCIPYFCIRLDFFSVQKFAIGDCLLMVPNLYNINLPFYPIVWWCPGTLNIKLPSTCSCVCCNFRNYVTLVGLHPFYDADDRWAMAHVHLRSFGWFSGTNDPCDYIRVIIEYPGFVWLYKDEEIEMLHSIPFLNEDNPNSFLGIFSSSFLFGKMARYNMTGIGINLREIYDDNEMMRLEVLELLDGLALSAGIRQNNKLLSVNVVDVKGNSAIEASLMPRGPSETSVSIMIKRGNGGSTQSVKIRRQSIAKSPVFFRLAQVKNGPTSVGYVDKYSLARLLRIVLSGMAALEAKNPQPAQVTCGSLLERLLPVRDEAGVTDEERAKMFLQLEHECLDLYQRKVNEAMKSRAGPLHTLVYARVVLANLLSALGEKIYEGILEEIFETLREHIALFAHKRTIIFWFLDVEEYGLIGAIKWVEENMQMLAAIALGIVAANAKLLAAQEEEINGTLGGYYDGTTTFAELQGTHHLEDKVVLKALGMIHLSVGGQQPATSPHSNPSLQFTQ